MRRFKPRTVSTNAPKMMITPTVFPIVTPTNAQGKNCASSRNFAGHSRSTRHNRRAPHTPQNESDEEQEYYVMTLLTDDAHHDTMTGLRRRWFPPLLLKVDAHITLFHALPESKLHEIKEDITSLAERTASFQIAARKDGIFEMGKGVGINVRIPRNRETGIDEAAAIRRSLRDKWAPLLSEQDRREKWRGHYTIMNKETDKETIEGCLNELKEQFEESIGSVLGLRLWRYDRGWWREPEDFLFSKNAPNGQQER